MKIELYDSDIYSDIEEDRKDGAVSEADARSGFIEGVKAAWKF